MWVSDSITQSSVLLWNKGIKRNQRYMVFGIQTGKGHFFPTPKGPQLSYMEDKGKEPCRRLRTKELLWKEVHRFKLGSLSYKSFLWQPRRV